MTTSEMTPADIRACTCGNDGYNNGMFGNNDWAWIIILLLFGYNGYGGFGGFGGRGFGASGAGCGAPCATQADVRAAVDQQTLISKLDQQTYGLADSTYALSNTITNGFHGVDNAICNLGYQNQAGINTLSAQLAQCCCDTRSAIKDVNTGIERAGWDLSRQLSDCYCDIEKMNRQSRFDAQAYNCNTLQAIDKLGDRLIDYMSNEKLQALRDENMALRLSASQSNQNAVLMAAMDANKAEILRRTGAECPSPAYLVNAPTPVSFPLNACGQVQFGNNCGCGCGYSA